MKPSVSLHLSHRPWSLATQRGRERAVAVALNIARGTPLEPQAYELELLDRFVRGESTLDEVLVLLEAQHESAQNVPVLPLSVWENVNKPRPQDKKPSQGS